MKKLLLLPLVFTCLFVYAQENQNHTSSKPIKKELFSLKQLDVLSNNSFGIDKATWVKFYNKTNVLLEKVDEESFLNYVVLKADGNFNDIACFLNYYGVDLTKDMQTLVYKVGKDEINSSTVSAYFTSLQPHWSNLFSEFQKNREQLLDEYKSLRGAVGGNLPKPLGCGSACTNPGFESGTSFWDYWSGDACTSANPCNQVAGFNTVQHELANAGAFDAVIGSALPVVPPGGGNNAMMLGDGPITGAYASRASISFDVSAANTSFTYKYAVVLEDPVSGHSDPERPYFRVKIRDASGNVVPCGDYEVIAKPPIANFISVGNNIYYRPWTTVSVPLTSYIGQCITIEFTSSDCSQGAYYGYAYIDADCNPLELHSSTGSCINAGTTDTLIAPPGAASYAWTNISAGGTTGIVGSDTSQTLAVNQSGTYQVIMTSVTGPTCITTLSIIHVMNQVAKPIADFEVTPTPLLGYNPVGNFINKSSTDVVYWHWEFGDGTSHPNTVTPSPSHLYPKAFDATYLATLIVKNTRGCVDTSTRVVLVGSEFSFFIPNAFTPNHDGMNDYFFGEGVGILNYNLSVFDRWGNKIFVGNDITSKWDGRVFNNSDIAQVDVYVWKVVFNDIYGEEHNYMGTVTLVR